MHTGRVKWFNPKKGFGFITRDDGGGDVFVHITELRKSGLDDLAEQQPVEFVMVPGKKGQQAANIRVA
jgi:cold shock protein